MAMTFRAMNRRVFAGEPLPHVFFQPRMEPWFHWHRIFGRLPARYRDATVREFYDDLDCSMRYIHYYTGVADPVVREFDANVRILETTHGAERRITYATPLGDLTMRLVLTVDQTWRTVGFPAKTPDDLKALRWLFEHTSYHFDYSRFWLGADFLGERGEPQFWVPKSPYQALAQQWMRLEDLIYALADAPQVVEDAMRAIDASYDPLYAELAAAGAGGREPRLRIINFGENIHEQLFSPHYWETYYLPFYERRCGQLRAAGVRTHIHIDGYFHNLLPYLRHLPFDGIEALTPLPQGDVTLEEMAAHMGDKVLLDGIPAVLFMPEYSREELLAMVEKLVALFHPRLVLGISDELPEGTGDEAAERVREVAQWARTHV